MGLVRLCQKKERKIRSYLMTLELYSRIKHVTTLYVPHPMQLMPRDLKNVSNEPSPTPWFIQSLDNVNSTDLTLRN